MAHESHQKLLSGDLCRGGVARRRVKVTLRDQILQQVNQSSARVRTGVHVNDVIRTTELEQRLSLERLQTEKY